MDWEEEFVIVGSEESGVPETTRFIDIITCLCLDVGDFLTSAAVWISDVREKAFVILNVL